MPTEKVWVIEYRTKTSNDDWKATEMCADTEIEAAREIRRRTYPGALSEYRAIPFRRDVNAVER